MVLIISSVSVSVNVMCLVIHAAVCLLILCSLGAIVIAVSWFSEVRITKCGNTVSVCNCKLPTPKRLELVAVFLNC